jgi:hypothetical protein
VGGRAIPSDLAARPAEPWNARGIKTVHPLGAAKAGTVHPDRPEHDHRGTVGGPRAAILQVPVGRQVVLAVVGGVDRHEDAVAQGVRAAADRAERVRVAIADLGHGGSITRRDGLRHP